MPGNSDALPTLDVGGKNIKVKFRFVSDAGSIQDTDVFGGFYIDDVRLEIDDVLLELD